MRRNRALRALALAATIAGGCTHALTDPAPSLASLTPSLFCSAQATSAVTVAGANLTPLPTHTLAGGEALVLPIVTLHGATDYAPPVRWESEQQLSFDVPADLALGVYDVTVGNPDGKSATLPGALTLIAPPSVTAAPPQICDMQADQTVTLTGQGFLVFGGTQPTVDVYDGSGTVVLTATATTSDCSPVAAPAGESVSACTTLAFTVAKSALTPGSYTLRVVDPPPAACQSPDAVTLTIMRGKC
jgi:hypothetical protein